MSIINAYDTSDEILKPQDIIQKGKSLPENVIVVFTQKFADLFKCNFDTDHIYSFTAGRELPVYKFCYKGKDIGLYHTMLGGSACAALLEETIALGAKKVLYFGSCGSLDHTISAGNLLIPEMAYRDEGTSYHYILPSDYIKVQTAEKLSNIFDELKVPYKKIRTWTTDAFYRETKNKMYERKKEGCIAVEMECASIMAVAQYRNIEVFEFLYAADCLDGKEWNAGLLGKMPEDMRDRIMKIAVETIIRV